jgi:hypothetical protein
MAMAAEAMAAMISDRRPGAARDRREAPLTLANAGLVRGGCTELESRPKLARQGRGYSCAPLDCHPIFSGRCMAAPRCAPTAVLPRCVLPAPVRCVSCVPRLCASVSSSCNATPLGLDSRPRSPAPVSIECAFEVESMRSSM